MKYQLSVVPAGKSENATFAEIESDFRSEVGETAVFGQLYIGENIPTFQCTILRGEPARYLHGHLQKAMKMQDAADSGQNDA